MSRKAPVGARFRPATRSAPGVPCEHGQPRRDNGKEVAAVLSTAAKNAVSRGTVTSVLREDAQEAWQTAGALR